MLSVAVGVGNQIITSRAILHDDTGPSCSEQESETCYSRRRENRTVMIENVEK
jgi:hypothetical protein